jgi:hypothetical protein
MHYLMVILQSVMIFYWVLLYEVSASFQPGTFWIAKVREPNKPMSALSSSSSSSSLEESSHLSYFFYATKCESMANEQLFQALPSSFWTFPGCISHHLHHHRCILHHQSHSQTWTFSMEASCLPFLSCILHFFLSILTDGPLPRPPSLKWMRVVCLKIMVSIPRSHNDQGMFWNISCTKGV